jgi:hypothetical protein
MKTRSSLVLVALLACGGTAVEGGDGGDASTGNDGTVGDAASTDSGSTDSGSADAGLSPACPSSAPDGGQACTSQVSCEYGTSNDPLCNTLYGCNGQVWSELYSGLVCDYTGTNDPSCPATYAQATGVCVNSNIVCEYPEGRCECVAGCGGPPPPPDAGDHWICTKASTGCPDPRGAAKIGAVCNTPGQQCTYGACCSGATQTCTGGIWTGNIMAGGCP